MKFYLSLFQAFLFCSISYSEPFSPTVLKLTVPTELSYKFDNSPLTIPVTVTGTPAALYLVINTKGQSENIKGVRNGYLGWHYVNKIDTTIYVSPRFEREVGETTITWDGIDENGNPAIPDSYDYYLWGYDNKSNRKLVCSFVQPNLVYAKHSTILENGEDGLPLARPLLVGNLPQQQCIDSWHESGTKRSFEEFGVHFKWVIGGDPLDQSILQTTICSMYQEMNIIQEGYKCPYYYYYCPVFDPHNFNIFYHCCRNDNAGVSTMLKWQFVTGGEAILDENWLGWDNLVWEESRKHIAGTHDLGLSCFTDGSYLYVPSTDNIAGERNILRCVSFEGEVIFEKMMHDWFFSPNVVNGIQTEYSFNGRLLNLDSRVSNQWLLSGPYCCLFQMIDTSRLLIDPDDETDMVMFENRNGDYFLDVGYQPELINVWFCNDYMDDKRKWSTGATRCGICIDSNDFNIVFTSYNRAEEHSFAVMSQDGTGIDNMAFGDEAPFTTTSGGNKYGGLIIDNGSGYDGFYIHRASSDDIQINTMMMDWRTFYVAFDSCHGVITNSPTSVEDYNQLQFTVEQNSPNPFNPSTVIRFTIPENNRVTVDIYNIAGQKVQTLVNAMMKAGAHSVTWDAGKYTSGVYMYKVKSGKFEKTMKMTLVK